MVTSFARMTMVIRNSKKGPDHQLGDTFLNKPLAERQTIAQSLRQESRETQANRAESISDAVESEIQHWHQRFSSTLLIRVHRPAVHLTHSACVA